MSATIHKIRRWYRFALQRIVVELYWDQNDRRIENCVSLLILSGVFLQSGCQTPPVASSLRAASEEEIAKVKPKWIEKRCNAELPRTEFVACATVIMRRMPALDMSKREQFGEHYDPKQWLECMKRSAETGGNGGTCDEDYALQRTSDPAYWPNPTMPPIKWPISSELPQKPSGMSNKEYFQMLCKTQAGEFIYRTVESVEGLYQVRPIHEPSDTEYRDRYVLEDPYSITRDSIVAPWKSFVKPKLGKYEYLEVATKPYKKNQFIDVVNPQVDFPNLTSLYIRFFRDENAHPKQEFAIEQDVVSAKPVENIQSKYGYTWRGLGDTALRDKGIAAGEQAVIDIATGEVLAVRRSFMYSDLRSRGLSVWWMGANHCSKEMTDPTNLFVNRVLKPIHAQQ